MSADDDHVLVGIVLFVGVTPGPRHHEGKTTRRVCNLMETFLGNVNNPCTIAREFVLISCHGIKETLHVIAKEEETKGSETVCVEDLLRIARLKIKDLRREEWLILEKGEFLGVECAQRNHLVS